MERKNSREGGGRPAFSEIKSEYISKKGKKQTKKEVLQQEEDEEDEEPDIFKMPPSQSRPSKYTYMNLKGCRERSWRLDALCREDGELMKHLTAQLQKQRKEEPRGGKAGSGASAQKGNRGGDGSRSKSASSTAIGKPVRGVGASAGKTGTPVGATNLGKNIFIKK